MKPETLARCYNLISALRHTARCAKNAIVSINGNIPHTGPDFFVIGATRAGSTYLHHLLNSHPSVFMPRIKELQYFNHDARYKSNLKGYRQLFQGYAGERVVGETTPLYLEAGTYFDKNNDIRFSRDESAIKRIHRHFPEAKLVVSIRDPLTRIPSIHAKNYYQGKVNTILSDEIQHELSGQSRLHHIFRNRYDIHLGEVFGFFHRDAVHIMIFEEWTKNLHASMNKLSRFLGIEPLPAWSAPPEKARNEAGRYRIPNGREPPDGLVRIDDALKDTICGKLTPSRKYLEQLLESELPWQ